jgi:signal transduction histidine kinase
MSIKDKLYLNAVISIALVVILLGLVLVTSDSINAENKRYALLNDVRWGVSELDIVTYDYLLHREKRMKQQWYLRYGSLGRIMENPTDEEAIKSIRDDYSDIGDLFSKLAQNNGTIERLRRQSASQEKIDRAVAIEKRLVARLLIVSHAVITAASRLAEEAHAKAIQAHRVAAKLTIVLTVFFAIAATAASLFIAENISKPLDALTNGAAIIGKGDLGHQVAVKTKDEFGQLAVAFNKMTHDLQAVTASRDELNTEVAERKQAQEDVRKYAQRLEQANIRLQEMDRLKSVFLASMSHELRTPLNSILGFTNIILQGMTGEINADQKKQLTHVKKNADHLLSLINDLLDISKIEAGKVELSMKEFNLNDVVQEVVEPLAPAASQNGLALVTQVPQGITLFSDMRRIKQVLINFVSNAIKFTDQGSVTITAGVQSDSNLEIRVLDTGVGIKKEDMAKLFLPFQQAGMSLTEKHKGTGLGLYLTKKIADLLGGDVSARSEYGRGSEFIFTMPLCHKP